MNSIPVVELHDVSKIYPMPAGDVHALNHINFSIQTGEFVAIMGPLGSGKSTLMNMIGCLDVPTSGEIKINGKSTSEMTDDEMTLHRRETIGFIFQKYNLISLLTAYENVEYPLILKHGHKDTTTRTADLLRIVDLTDGQVQHTHPKNFPAVSSRECPLPGILQTIRHSCCAMSRREIWIRR